MAQSASADPALRVAERRLRLERLETGARSHREARVAQEGRIRPRQLAQDEAAAGARLD
jgi:hypothetical protein